MHPLLGNICGHCKISETLYFTTNSNLAILRINNWKIFRFKMILKSLHQPLAISTRHHAYQHHQNENYSFHSVKIMILVYAES